MTILTTMINETQLRQKLKLHHFLASAILPYNHQATASVFLQVGKNMLVWLNQKVVVVCHQTRSYSGII